MCYKKISNGAGTRKLTIPMISGEPLPKELEIIRKKIVDVRLKRIHKTLGPVLLEKVYDGIIFQEGLRLDVKVLSDLFYKFSGISCFSGKKPLTLSSYKKKKLINKSIPYELSF